MAGRPVLGNETFLIKYAIYLNKRPLNTIQFAHRNVSSLDGHRPNDKKSPR